MNIIGSQKKTVCVTHFSLLSTENETFPHDFPAGTKNVRLRTMDGPQMHVDQRLLGLLQRAKIMDYRPQLLQEGFDDYEQLLHMSDAELRTLQICVRMREGHFLRLSKELQLCRQRENVEPSVNPSVDTPPSVVGVTDSLSVHSTPSESSVTSAQQMARRNGNYANSVGCAHSVHSVPVSHGVPSVSHGVPSVSSSDCTQPRKRKSPHNFSVPMTSCRVSMDKGPHETVEQVKLAVYRNSTDQGRQARLATKTTRTTKTSGGRRKEYMCAGVRDPDASFRQCKYKVIFRRKQKPRVQWVYDEKNSNPVHCPMPICCPNQKVKRLELEKDPVFIREVLAHKKMTGKSAADAALGRDGRMAGSVKAHTARRARNTVMYGADKDYVEDFCKLPAWGRQFVADNPGSVFHIEKTVDNK